MCWQRIQPCRRNKIRLQAASGPLVCSSGLQPGNRTKVRSRIRTMTGGFGNHRGWNLLGAAASFETTGQEQAAGQGMGPDSNHHQVTSACTSKRKGTQDAAPRCTAACSCMHSGPLAPFTGPAVGHLWLKPGASSSPRTAEIICAGQCWLWGPCCFKVLGVHSPYPHDYFFFFLVPLFYWDD